MIAMELELWSKLFARVVDMMAYFVVAKQMVLLLAEDRRRPLVMTF
jgi:hypothetical protein